MCASVCVCVCVGVGVCVKERERDKAIIGTVGRKINSWQVRCHHWSSNATGPSSTTLNLKGHPRQ